MEVAWYERHILATRHGEAKTAASQGVDTEAVAAEFWTALAEDADAARLGTLATAFASMPWNAHLLNVLVRHGFMPGQAFAPSPSSRVLLDALSAIGE